MFRKRTPRGATKEKRISIFPLIFLGIENAGSCGNRKVRHSSIGLGIPERGIVREVPGDRKLGLIRHFIDTFFGNRYFLGGSKINPSLISIPLYPRLDKPIPLEVRDCIEATSIEQQSIRPE